MKIEKDLQVLSLLLRLSMGTLFLGAAIIKIPGGTEGTVSYYMSMFEKSMLPVFLVKMHASVILFVELGLALWLLSGHKLKAAWLASALTLISLAFGMIFVHKFDVVSDNYVYVLISGVGYILASYDQLTLGGKLKK